MTKIPNYSHFVSVVERVGRRFVRIDRVLPDGSREFYTELELLPKDAGEDWEKFEEVMCNVGKSMGIDSPAVRNHFGLDDEE